MGAYYYVDETQVTKVIKALDSNYKAVRPTIKEAVNKTAKEAQSKLINRAKEVYAYNKGLAKKDLKLTKATVSNLTARLYSSGRNLELSHFVKRGPVAPSGTVYGAPATQAKAIKSHSMKSLQYDGIKAFIAKFNNGHTSIVTRVKDFDSRKSSLGSRYLKTIQTVSVPGMIGNEEKVWNYISPQLGEMLSAEVNKAIARRQK